MLAERLIANLVDNAIQYNIAAGDIWVSTRTTTGSSQLTVANTGPVISPADAGRIFQPFQRLSYRTSHDGFGLGLAIVASIAAIHDGTVTARPRHDGGLSVTVTIPSAGVPARAPAGMADRPWRVLAESTWPGCGKLAATFAGNRYPSAGALAQGSERDGRPSVTLRWPGPRRLDRVLSGGGGVGASGWDSPAQEAWFRLFEPPPLGLLTPMMMST
ncbi:MAG: sensor histidine kinase [Streptosporangiaceae bacterium]